MTAQQERPEAMTLTLADLRAEGRARFGPDPLDWRFVCPRCGDIASGRHFVTALVKHPRVHQDGSDLQAGHVLGQECIGRTLGALDHSEPYEGRGCNLAAYGLFPGPWTVQLPGGGEMRCFPLAPAPGEEG